MLLVMMKSYWMRLDPESSDSCPYKEICKAHGRIKPMEEEAETAVHIHKLGSAGNHGKGRRETKILLRSLPAGASPATSFFFFF